MPNTPVPRKAKRRRRLPIAVAAAVTAGTLAIGGGVALAQPMSCTDESPPTGYSVICYHGTGTYTAHYRCYKAGFHDIYGYTRRVGSGKWSNALSQDSSCTPVLREIIFGP